jgi:hypothetical protein
MDGTILGQGTFTQTSGSPAVTVAIPSGADFMYVYNYTQASATSGNGFKYYWQRGMGTIGIAEITGSSHAVTANITAANAFVYQDYNNPPTFALNNGSTGISAWSSATPPVLTVGSTAGVPAGSIVRLTGLATTASTSIVGYNSIDFTVGYGTLTSTTMSLDYVLGGVTTTSTGNFRVIGYPVTSQSGSPAYITSNGLFYPSRRYITNMTAAASCVITMSVQHNFTVGQEIRLSLPGGSAVWGSYAALDNYSSPNSGTTPDSWIITAVDTATGNTHNTITINANTTGFGSFAFPTTLSSYTPAQVIPFGEDTATALAQSPALSSLGDAVQNVQYLGMTLAGGTGASAPAGQSGDVVYWIAGKSMYGGS